MSESHDHPEGWDFIQEAPRTPNLWEADAPLHAELNKRLKPETLQKVTHRLEKLGEATAGEMVTLANAAESHPPVHVPFDPWGRRIDRIDVHPAWDELKRLAAEHGIVATGYDERLGAERRVVQAALLHLYSASSATFSCPLAMTDAAARVLLDVAPASVRNRLFGRLTSTDPEQFITSGQWMTERTGGSDVSGTSTVATPIVSATSGEPRYALSGTKWFTSATTSEMALTLGRIDDGSGHVVQGSRGLTLFCVELDVDEHGRRPGIIVNRLKDKLGTRALPTAELELRAKEATRLGEPGRGVPEIATMLNVTRLYNALASASGMARATWMAHDYATRRVAFGRRLIEHDLHRRTLDGLAAQTAGALALSFEVAELLGKLEAESASDDEKRRLRALIPLAKLTLGKQAVRVASEALECFGGAGYVEDTHLPRLLRDAQVLPIWEGTTNVLSLDVLRAEAKEQAFSAVLTDLAQRLEQLPTSLNAHARDAIAKTLGRVKKATDVVSAEGGPGIQAYARDLALTTGDLAECVFLGETAAHADDDGDERFARLVSMRLQAPLAAIAAS
jgi:alkylation response protein AidB-like acyl-CoA dehydrogenase